MTFGRPSMIESRSDVPIPAIIDDEYLSEDGSATQPVGIPSRLGLFASSCALFEVLEEILVRFYRDGFEGFSKQEAGPIQPSTLLTPVLDFNHRLDEFAETVPQYLRVGSNEFPETAHVQLQQQVLLCRFLYVRLLSLRPLLLVAIRRESKPMPASLDDEVTRSCCNICISTACKLIDTLHMHLGTLYRSSGWHTIYFTFASAIVLLAASKAKLPFQVSPDEIEASWSRCFHILEFYRHQIPSADSAAAILRTLKVRASEGLHGLSEESVVHDEFVGQREAQLINGSTLDTQSWPQLSLEDITESWFGQQLVNLDWLNQPQS